MTHHLLLQLPFICPYRDRLNLELGPGWSTNSSRRTRRKKAPSFFEKKGQTKLQTAGNGPVFFSNCQSFLYISLLKKENGEMKNQIGKTEKRRKSETDQSDLGVA